MNNKKGSAMIWAMVAGTIVTTLVLGMYGGALAYYKQTVRTADINQAYLEAKSTLKTLTEAVADGAVPPDFETITDPVMQGITTGPSSGETIKCTITNSKVNDFITKITLDMTDYDLTLNSYLQYFPEVTEEGGHLPAVFPDILVPDPYGWFEWGKPQGKELKALNLRKDNTVEDFQVGNTDGSDSYYSVAEGKYGDGNGIVAVGTGNVYIFVEPNAVLTLNKMESHPTKGAGHPQIYIIVSDGSNIWLRGNGDMYGYLYVPGPGSQVKNFMNGILHGSAIVANKITPASANTNQWQYVQPAKPIYVPGFPPGNVGDGTLGQITPAYWRVAGYEKE